MKKQLLMLSCLIVVLLSQIVQLMRVGAPVAQPIRVGEPAPTLWTKQDVLIEMERGPGLSIWTDNIQSDRDIVDRVEGVISTELLANGHMIYARIDLRYDKILVAKAITVRLKSAHLQNSH